MKSLSPGARALIDQARDSEERRVLPARERERMRAAIVRRVDASHGEGSSLGLVSRPRGWLRAAAAAGFALGFRSAASAWASVGISFVAGAGVATVVVSALLARPVTQHARIPAPANIITAKPHDGPAPAPASAVSSASVNTAASAVLKRAPRRAELGFREELPATRSAPSAEPISAPADRTLSEEAALLRRAQQAIRNRDGERAFALLDEYTTRFPRGALLVEARAARIVASCELRDRDEGRRLAGEFARTRPDSPLLARIAAACGESLDRLR